MADEIKYEYKTVRALRGTDGLVISKMQKDGWEYVEKEQGKLRSALDFRRPKKPVPWLLIGGAAAVVVILVVVIGVASALGGGDEKDEKPAGSTVAATKKPSARPTPTASAPITPEADPEFAALLKGDSCDEANAAFATKHQGEKIAFDGSIVNMMPHGDYHTRYDLLLGPGDRGSNTAVGPAFKYDDVNMYDLSLTGKEVPATVGTGDKFRFVAEVGEYNATQCLFYLHPVSTEAR
ncbi:DUF4839 domain-containing protein [Streptomyces griseoluteus]|uniref:DUF4839 domain-containing protein n=1 Tax=Streptomyces griseoluteus TaxID=29306 RepID=UPI00380E3378